MPVILGMKVLRFLAGIESGRRISRGEAEKGVEDERREVVVFGIMLEYVRFYGEEREEMGCCSDGRCRV